MNQAERDELLIRLDERQNMLMNKVSEVHTEVKKTNGRVTLLENERIPHIEKWMSSTKGSFRTLILVFSALGVVLGIIATAIAH